jgi:hypothetical protein
MIRKAHLRARVNELETEMRILCELHEKQRVDLLRDLRGEIEQDIIGRLRVENKEQVAEAKRRHRQLIRLAELARAVLRLDAFDPRAPVIDQAKAEQLVRRLLVEIEESEKVDPGPTAEQITERQGIGKKVDWPVESGKAS